MLIKKVEGFLQDLDENEFEHEIINCPTAESADGNVEKCNAISKVDNVYFVCDDCPIDWSLLRKITPVEKSESEYEHRKIMCPAFVNSRVDCDAKFTLFGGFAPCDDCPIDWKKVRINIKYEEHHSLHNCANCYFSTNSMECMGGGFKTGYNADMEIECQNWEKMVF